MIIPSETLDLQGFKGQRYGIPKWARFCHRKNLLKSTNALCYGAKCWNMKMYWYYCAATCDPSTFPLGMDAFSVVLNSNTFLLGERGYTPRPPYRGVLHSVLPSRLVNAVCR